MWTTPTGSRAFEIAESGMDGPVAADVATSHTEQADLIEDLLAERRARIQRFADPPCSPSCSPGGRREP